MSKTADTNTEEPGNDSGQKPAPLFLCFAMAAMLGCVLLFQHAGHANEVGEILDAGDMTCPDANIFSGSMFSDVCWDCLFPIRIAGVDVGSQGNNSPPGAANGPLCYCPGCGYYGRIGVTVGYWSPSRIIEQVRSPYCFPSLGGTEMSDFSSAISKLNIGRHATGHTLDSTTPGTSYGHWHYYTYPILAILGLFDQYDCIDDGIDDFDLVFVSEIFPNWADDELSSYLNPEAAMFANPIAMAAGPIDCVAATAMNPIDSLFWVSGCWGSNYPLAGRIWDEGSPQRGASLRTSRALFLLSRLGFITRQMGDDAYCKGQRTPVLVKSMFRKQQMWPLPETSSGAHWEGDGGEGSPFDVGSMLPVCCHPLGASTLAWGEWRQIPAVAEDYVYLNWKWVDCCVGVCI